MGYARVARPLELAQLVVQANRVHLAVLRGAETRDEGGVRIAADVFEAVVRVVEHTAVSSAHEEGRRRPCETGGDRLLRALCVVLGKLLGSICGG